MSSSSLMTLPTPRRRRSRRRGTRRAPRSDDITSCGSPSISLRPASTAIIRSTTRSSACTMCSIHTIDTPVARMPRDRVDQLEHLGLGQAAGDLVEQQQRRLRRQRPGQLEPLAVEQRQRAGQRRWPCRACRPVRSASTAASSLRAATAGRRRRTCCRRARSRTRVSPSNGRGICAVRPMPRRQRACAGCRLMSTPAEERRCRGRAAGRRRSRLSSVVLPAPFGPTMPRASPSATSNVNCVDHLQAAEALADVVDLRAVPSCRQVDGQLRRAASACRRPGSPATASCW